MKHQTIKSAIRNLISFILTAYLIFLTSTCGIFSPGTTPDFSSPPDLTICDYLRIDFPEVDEGGCCRKLAIISSYPQDNYSGLSIPTQFKLVSEEGQIISWETGMDATLIGATEHEVYWGGLSIPYGRVELGEICFAENFGGEINFEWINLGNQKICEDSIDVFCGTNDPISNPPVNCCVYNVNLVNLIEPNDPDPIIQKVRIMALDDTEIVNSDPDFFEELVSTSNVVEWKPPSPLEFFPPGASIDNDFTLYVKPSDNPHKFHVDWLDGLDNLICRHLVELDCNESYGEDVDWSNFTTTTSINNSELFAFFSIDDIAEDCGRDDMTYKTDECTVDFADSVKCESNVRYLYLHGPAEYDIFKWYIYHVEGDSDIPVEVDGENPPPIVLSEVGNYEIDLMAIDYIDENTADTCYGDGFVTIYNYDPDFSYERLNCEYQYKFDAKGYITSQVERVEWSCEEVDDFPEEGHAIIFDFPGEGTYLVEMTIVDIYGCTHPYSESVIISNECSPKFAHSYSLCASDCEENSEGEISITVSFKKFSGGGVCPIIYTWDFGDGSTLEQIDNDNERAGVSHVYLVNQNSCKTGENYTVKLTMKDALGCKKVYSKTIKITFPSPFFTEVKNCDDGKYMVKANLPGEWSLSAGTFSHSLNADQSLHYDEYNQEYIPDCVVIQFEESGTYEVKLNALDINTGGRCEISQILNVELKCCSKNEKKKDKTPPFSVDDDTYKMKYKFVQRQLPFVHHVKAKTKLKRKKSLPFPKNWTYYTSHKADTIHASFDGMVYKHDKSEGVSCTSFDGGCSCKIEMPVTDENPDKVNKKKAKAKHGALGKFRSKPNSIESIHYVVIGGTKKEKKLYLGDDEDCYKWWIDWFY